MTPSVERNGLAGIGLLHLWAFLVLAGAIWMPGIVLPGSILLAAVAGWLLRRRIRQGAPDHDMDFILSAATLMLSLMMAGAAALRMFRIDAHRLWPLLLLLPALTAAVRSFRRKTAHGVGVPGMSRGIVLLLAAAGLMAGQTFEAASVKSAGRNIVPGVTFQMKGGPGTSDPARISYNQNLIVLLEKAWDVPIDQLSGPAWLKDIGGQDYYAITATLPASTTREQFQKMLQNLLIERFQISLHHETRNFPGYDLVVAPGGPRFKETTQDPNLVPGPLLPPQRNPDGSFKLPPGPQVLIGEGPGTSRGQYQAKSMTEFASNLGITLGRALGLDANAGQPRVLDKTGLTAKYDFTVEFDCRGCAGLSAAMRASLPLLAGRGGDGTPAGATDPGSGLPDIFAAFQKQLGLKLVKVKDIPVDVVVFDRVEKVPLPD